MAAPLNFMLSEGTTLTLGSMSAMGCMMNTIRGSVQLSTLSAVMFMGDASFYPTSALVPPVGGFSAIVCNGNWWCVGAYGVTGNPTNVLIINQPTGGAVFHGTNAADSVLISNDNVEARTLWNSSNTVLSLTVSTTGTLEIAEEQVLSVGTLLNMGNIVETAPAHIHHPAESLTVSDEKGTPGQIIFAGSALQVHLRDADENLHAAALDTAAGIVVTNQRNQDTLAVSATETSTSLLAAFVATVPTVVADAAVADGLLQVQPGDVLRIQYTDNEDPLDNAAGAIAYVMAPSAARDWTEYR
jgi:hypothetical protein